nr:low density lipoprotein receptor adapter protein 1 [Loxodonta africana]
MGLAGCWWWALPAGSEVLSCPVPELPENWTDTRETLLEGMLFSLKYLGMTMVEQPKGEELSAAAVKRIVATAKASGKKLQKVTLKVSPRGIILTDSITNQLIENVSIYRISYCTADKMHDKVFAYIAQSQHSETLECHAFLCTKRKMVSGERAGWGGAGLALVVLPCTFTDLCCRLFQACVAAGALKDQWGEKREGESQPEGGTSQRVHRDSTPSLKSPVATGNLLDLEETAKAPLSTVSANTPNMDEAPRPQTLSTSSVVWELDDGLDEAFSRLAQSRTNPQVLDIGLTAQDIHYAQCLSPVDWDKPDGGGTEQDDLFSF